MNPDLATPLRWMDAVEATRPEELGPASTVATLAPQIEAFCQAQGLAITPSHAQAAAQVCLAQAAVEPCVSEGTVPAAKALDHPQRSMFLGAMALVMTLGVWAGCVYQDRQEARKAQARLAAEQQEDALSQVSRLRMELALEQMRQRLPQAMSAAGHPQRGNRPSATLFRHYGLQVSQAFVDGYSQARLTPASDRP